MTRRIPDITRIRAILGRVLTSLEEGLQLMLNLKPENML